MRFGCRLQTSIKAAKLSLHNHIPISAAAAAATAAFVSRLKMKSVIVLVVVLVGVCLAAPGGYGGYGGGGYGGGGYGGGGYGGGGYGGGGQSNIYHSQQTDHYGNTGPYKFGYNVNDHYTGDYHGRDEVGDGYGGVSGSYHLREPDGRIRVVKYVADYNGFRATVNGVPHGYGGYH